MRDTTDRQIKTTPDFQLLHRAGDFISLSLHPSSSCTAGDAAIYTDIPSWLTANVRALTWSPRRQPRADGVSPGVPVNY